MASAARAAPSPASTGATASDATASSIPADAWQRISEQIAAARYDIDARADGRYGTIQPAMGLRALFGPAGVELTPHLAAGATEPAWQLTMRPTAYGFAGAM